jgi:hypothetical protein
MNSRITFARSWYSDGLWAGQGLIAGREKIFLFSTASRLALGPTPPPVPWLLVKKWQGCEADHLSPSNAEFKNGGAISPLPNTSLWCQPFLLSPV